MVVIELQLRAAPGQVIIGGSSGIVHARVHRLAEGVSRAPDQTAPEFLADAGLGRVEPSAAAVQNVLYIVEAQIGPSLVHRGGAERNSCHRRRAVLDGG